MCRVLGTPARLSGRAGRQAAAATRGVVPTRDVDTQCSMRSHPSCLPAALWPHDRSCTSCGAVMCPAPAHRVRTRRACEGCMPGKTHRQPLLLLLLTPSHTDVARTRATPCCWHTLAHTGTHWHTLAHTARTTHLPPTPHTPHHTPHHATPRKTRQKSGQQSISRQARVAARAASVHQHAARMVGFARPRPRPAWRCCHPRRLARLQQLAAPAPGTTAADNTHTHARTHTKRFCCRCCQRGHTAATHGLAHKGHHTNRRNNTHTNAHTRARTQIQQTVLPECRGTAFVFVTHTPTRCRHRSRHHPG
jgi:hypothetical protein